MRADISSFLTTPPDVDPELPRRLRQDIFSLKISVFTCVHGKCHPLKLQGLNLVGTVTIKCL